MSVVKPKQAMQSFAVDKEGDEVFFLAKDGTIGVGLVTPAPMVIPPSCSCMNKLD